MVTPKHPEEKAPLDESDSTDSDSGDLLRTKTEHQEAASDSEDGFVLQRTGTVKDGRQTIEPAMVSSNQEFRVKNTFIEVDVERTESDQSCPDRTRSDPSGSRFPLPGLPKKLVPRVSAVPEEQVTAAAESDSDECGQDLSERLETYDHFSASQQPLEGYLGPHMHMPEMGMPMMAPMMVGMPQMGLDYGAWADQSHAEVLPKAPPQMEGQAPPFGMLHSFHKEVRGFGLASNDLRQFTKGQDYEGRLSVISGSEVQKGGVQRYLMQFSYGELTKADGIGFVFASRVPCAKNIQKIVSVFVNQRGRICMRVFGDILKAKKHVRALQVGDWVEMVVDLENSIATFKVWPYETVASGFPEPESIAEFNYGKRLAQAQQLASKPVKLNVGHFACVIQNVGVTVTMGSWSTKTLWGLDSSQPLFHSSLFSVPWFLLHLESRLSADGSWRIAGFACHIQVVSPLAR